MGQIGSAFLSFYSAANSCGVTSAVTLDDAREKIEAWRVDYNEYRPHESLNDRTPQEFVKDHQQAAIF